MREKLTCKAVATEASANPMESSRLGVVFLSSPIEARGLGLCIPALPVTGSESSLQGGQFPAFNGNYQ